MQNNTPNNFTPRVSIALPVYNGENYLTDALDSLLSQSYENFELIIGDNASTDDTKNICETYAKKDQRIRYIRHKTNIGAAGNYNYLFELAQGEYFKWAAHDDVCSPDYLQRSVDKLDSDPSIILCCPKEIAIDGNGDVIENYMDKYPPLKNLASSSTYRRFYDLSCLNHGCYMVFGLTRTQKLKFTPKIANYLGSDRVLLAELSLFGRFWKSPEPIYFRRHSEQFCALENDTTRTDWFNPDTEQKFAFMDSTNFIEYGKAIHRVNLSWSKKISCYFVLIIWIIKKRRHLFKELMIIINDRF